MKILPFLPPTQLCDVSAAALCWSISDKLILRHILHKTGGLWTFVLSDFWTRTSDWLCCARKVTSCGCTDWQCHIACVFLIFVFLIFVFLHFNSFILLYFAFFSKRSAQCKNIKVLALPAALYHLCFFCFWSAFFNCASLEFYSFICVIVSFLTTVWQCVRKVTSCSRTDTPRHISSCCPKMSNLWMRMQQSRFW